MIHQIKNSRLDSDICCLIFGEVYLKTSLNYDIQNDSIISKCNLGTDLKSKNQLAKFALTVMLSSIKQNFKIPISFYLNISLVNESYLNQSFSTQFPF